MIPHKLPELIDPWEHPHINQSSCNKDKTLGVIRAFDNFEFSPVDFIHFSATGPLNKHGRKWAWYGISLRMQGRYNHAPPSLSCIYFLRNA